jgi:hypothetical protein
MLNRRLLSPSPIIKGHPEFSEPVDPPEELLEIRNRLGFDYGKFDYVMHKGKVHIIDANKTPGNPDVPETNTTMCSKLAQGILDFI